MEQPQDSSPQDGSIADISPSVQEEVDQAIQRWSNDHWAYIQLTMLLSECTPPVTTATLSESLKLRERRAKLEDKNVSRAHREQLVVFVVFLVVFLTGAGRTAYFVTLGKDALVGDILKFVAGILAGVGGGYFAGARSKKRLGG